MYNGPVRVKADQRNRDQVFNVICNEVIKKYFYMKHNILKEKNSFMYY